MKLPRCFNPECNSGHACPSAEVETLALAIADPIARKLNSLCQEIADKAARDELELDFTHCLLLFTVAAIYLASAQLAALKNLAPELFRELCQEGADPASVAVPGLLQMYKGNEADELDRTTASHRAG